MNISDTGKKIIIGASCLISGLSGGFILGQIVAKKIIDNRMSESLGITLDDAQQITGTGLLISRDGVDYNDEYEDDLYEDILKDNKYTLSDEDEKVLYNDHSKFGDLIIDNGENNPKTTNSDIDMSHDSLTARLSRMKDEIDEMKAMTESPSEEDKPIEPYIITPEEYTDTYLNYYKTSVVYLAEDGVVVDENKEAIEDVDRYLGFENLEVLRKHEDLAMMYIRDERNYTDYEVEKVFSNFLDYTGAATADTASDEIA